MAITNFNKNKLIDVPSISGTPTISRIMCFKITSGNDSTTGTGKIVLDWTNIFSKADIGIYNENNNFNRKEKHIFPRGKSVVFCV